jgi:hypothetical protein
MTSRDSFRQGFRLALRARSVVWILLLVNLGLAALAALPIYRGILRFTGDSLMSRELASGSLVDWLTDFSFNNPGSLHRYGQVITAAALVSILVNSVLAGGVLSRFRTAPEGAPAGSFFRDAGRYAWRMVRLMIIGLVCYWVVFRVLDRALGNFIERRTADWLDDRSVFWVRLGWGALVAAGVGFVNVVMDYARVKLVMEDSSSAAYAFLASLGFTLGRLRRTVTVWAVPSLCGVALLGIYRLLIPWQFVNASAPEATWSNFREPLTLALLFIAQQVIMFGRYWFRVATWASEWSYYSGSRKS